LMEVTVVTLPLLQLTKALLHHAFGRGELVMCGDDTPLPLDIGIGERGLHRMRFQQQAKFCEFSEILDRDLSYFEAAPALRQHKAVGRQSAQYLAQRADADAVTFLEAVELQPRAGLEAAKDDIR